MDLTSHKLQCLVCAWRMNCQKRFYFESQAGRVNCPDFSRDVTLPQEKEKEGDAPKA